MRVPDASLTRPHSSQALLGRMDEVVSAWDRKAEGGWRKAEAGCSAEDLRAKVERGIDRGWEGGGDEFGSRLIQAIHKWLLGEARGAATRHQPPVTRYQTPDTRHQTRLSHQSASPTSP